MSGVVQQGNNPRMVQVDLGTVEAVLPANEQVPGEVPARYPSARLPGRGTPRPQGPFDCGFSFAPEPGVAPV